MLLLLFRQLLRRARLRRFIGPERLGLAADRLVRGGGRTGIQIGGRRAGGHLWPRCRNRGARRRGGKRPGHGTMEGFELLRKQLVHRPKLLAHEPLDRRFRRRSRSPRLGGDQRRRCACG